MLLKQHDIDPAKVGEVVGDAAADDPAADYNHLGPAGQFPA